jgi:hypothetical protein
MRTTPQPYSSLARLRPILIVSALGALCGCSYLETQLQRRAPPDGRITLGWQDRVQLHSRDIVNYKCEDRYFLRCDNAGAVTLSCTCSLR